MDMSTTKSCCAQLECFKHNGILLHAYCGQSVQAAGNLFHSVISKRYYVIYAHCCLQHPLIYNQVRYCNIYSIIWLADFQFKFYIRERGGYLFLFLYEGGSPFLQFSSMGVTNFSESFASPPLDINTGRSLTCYRISITPSLFIPCLLYWRPWQRYGLKLHHSFFSAG